jgi:hypothetical protein
MQQCFCCLLSYFYPCLCPWSREFKKCSTVSKETLCLITICQPKLVSQNMIRQSIVTRCWLTYCDKAALSPFVSPQWQTIYLISWHENKISYNIKRECIQNSKSFWWEKTPTKCGNSALSPSVRQTKNCGLRVKLQSYNLWLSCEKSSPFPSYMVGIRLQPTRQELFVSLFTMLRITITN